MIPVPPLALEASVVCLGIFLLMLDSFTKFDKTTLVLTGIAGLVVIFGGTFLLDVNGPVLANPDFYLLDAKAIFFKRFLLLATILTLVLALDYGPVYLRYVPSAVPQAGLGEFFTLPVFVCAGLMWMVSATDFIVIFVSLELVTIGFYILVASMRKNIGSLEAGVKYLILGALSTGFLVYGITWLFGLTRETSLFKIGAILPMVPEAYHGAALFGFALIVVGLGFKVAAVPFQFWVPDVYQGAPTPITAYLSVASKAAGFVVLWRVVALFLAAPAFHAKVQLVLVVLAAATLLFGNLAALQQSNLKRLMGYSSIAHAGYLLIGVASLNPLAAPGPIQFAPGAIIYYLAGYLVMTFLSFLVIVNVAKATGGDDISDFNGLGRRSPVLAGGLLVAMLSLAGVPFTMGFLGKFFIFQAAMQEHHYLLVILGAITVACGFYYYLKPVRAMFWQSAPQDAPEIRLTAFGKTLIGVLCLATFVFGVFPQPIFNLLNP